MFCCRLGADGCRFRDVPDSVASVFGVRPLQNRPLRDGHACGVGGGGGVASTVRWQRVLCFTVVSWLSRRVCAGWMSAVHSGFLAAFNITEEVEREAQTAVSQPCLPHIFFTCHKKGVSIVDTAIRDPEGWMYRKPRYVLYTFVQIRPHDKSCPRANQIAIYLCSASFLCVRLVVCFFRLLQGDI